jgi:hypothetical protein
VVSSALWHQSSSSSRAAKIFYDHRLAQDGWNCRFSRRGGLTDIGMSCHTTFSIVNRQSAIGNQPARAGQ